MATEQEGTFRTYGQYVRAFAHIAGFTKPDEPPNYRLRVIAREADAAPSAQVNRRDADLSQIQSSLANAWGTELLLELNTRYTADDALLVRLTNTWAVVQAYYALYHAAISQCVAPRASAASPALSASFSAARI